MKKLVLAVLFSGAAFTAYANEAKADKFKKLDKNNDGAVTVDEAKAEKKLSEGYSTADADKDGKVTEAEYKEFEGKSKPEGHK